MDRNSVKKMNKDLLDDKKKPKKSEKQLFDKGNNKNTRSSQTGKATGKATTWRQKFNKKHGKPLNDSSSLAEIARLEKIPINRLRKVYSKGIGAWKTNIASVRLKSGKKAPNAPRSAKMGKEQWAMARVYSAVMGGPAAKVDKHELAGTKPQT